ncbi:hypothetical protein, partial [Acinetobacter baumannii]|uniref:hypothetical protein n=1 Tax=Acinetobacter baumannii TaxID=470 RepID=UPI001969ACE0
MHTITAGWGIMLAVIWTVLFVLSVPGLLRVPHLPSVVPARQDGPLISIVLAARNEKERIGSTLSS